MRALLIIALFFVAACHRPQPADESPTPSIQEKRAERTAEVPEATQREWTYLNRIRQSDTFNTAIAHTLVDDQNQLGFVLFSSVPPGQVPELMRKLMTEMAQEFPHQDMTLIVYGESVPLHKIGEAHLSGETGETTYTPAK